jgi:hypothetical protein
MNFREFCKAHPLAMYGSECQGYTVEIVGTRYTGGRQRTKARAMRGGRSQRRALFAAQIAAYNATVNAARAAQPEKRKMNPNESPCSEAREIIAALPNLPESNTHVDVRPPMRNAVVYTDAAGKLCIMLVEGGFLRVESQRDIVGDFAPFAG